MNQELIKHLQTSYGEERTGEVFYHGQTYFTVKPHYKTHAQRMEAMEIAMYSALARELKFLGVEPKSPPKIVLMVLPLLMALLHRVVFLYLVKFLNTIFVPKYENLAIAYKGTEQEEIFDLLHEHDVVLDDFVKAELASPDASNSQPLVDMVNKLNKYRA